MWYSALMLFIRYGVCVHGKPYYFPLIRYTYGERTKKRGKNVCVRIAHEEYKHEMKSATFLCYRSLNEMKQSKPNDS